ncbi:MAG: hypothetical protein JOZ19_05215 [Rubrobacter sp.]|nr:hypothetical protein [Rubrobacter sp.]
MADEVEERDTMVHALREEPGSYTIALEDETEITYAIRPTGDGFTAGWDVTGLRSSGKRHEKTFASYADALRYLERNFDAPFSPQES